MSTDVSRPPRDALDLARVVLARVEHRAVLAYTLRAEVEAAHELAHDDEVDGALFCWAEVRIHVELRAEPQHSLLRAHVGGVELGVADRRLEHRGGGAARLEGRVGEGVASRSDRGRSEQVVLELEIRGELAQHPLRGSHHFGADAVPG